METLTDIISQLRSYWVHYLVFSVVLTATVLILAHVQNRKEDTVTTPTTKQVLIGKRYTNHTGRQFVRVAIPESNGQGWTMDLRIRESRHAVPHISGVREIRAAAIEHYEAGFGSTYPDHILHADFPKHFPYHPEEARS